MGFWSKLLAPFVVVGPPGPMGPRGDTGMSGRDGVCKCFKKAKADAETATDLAFENKKRRQEAEVKVIARNPDGPVFRGYYDHPSAVWQWRKHNGPWREHKGQWRRWDFLRGQFFGLPSHERFIETDDGGRFYERGEFGAQVFRSSTFEGRAPGVYPTTAEPIPGIGNHDRAANGFGGNVSPSFAARFSPSAAARWDACPQLEKTMTPLLIHMMLHFYAIADRFPDPSYGSPAYREGLQTLLNQGMIAPTPRKVRERFSEWEYQATEKGRVYVEALKRVPLPVAAEAEWTMPK